MWMVIVPLMFVSTAEGVLVLYAYLQVDSVNAGPET